jgi:hypothetical protein
MTHKNGYMLYVNPQKPKPHLSATRAAENLLLLN